MASKNRDWFSLVLDSVDVALRRAIGPKCVIISMGSRNPVIKNDFKMRLEAIDIVQKCLSELIDLVHKYYLVKKGDPDGYK